MTTNDNAQPLRYRAVCTDPATGSSCVKFGDEIIARYHNFDTAYDFAKDLNFTEFGLPVRHASKT